MTRIAINSSTRNGYALYWVVDGDLGGEVGEITPSRRKPGSVESDGDRELRLAFEAAKPFADDHPRNRGFVFETMARAKQADAAVRAAFKADAAEQAGKPWPDWAKTAAANNWKPPKGWKP
jgi:hypothetical protein